MSKKNTPQDDSMSLSRPVGWIEKRNVGLSSYLAGSVATQYGIVSVLSQGDDKRDCFTRLDFCAGGRMMIRHYYKRYTIRGLVMLANRFAKEADAAMKEGKCQSQ